MNDERGMDCIQTYDGGFILLGIDNRDGTGYGYLILAKIDSVGNLIWSKDYTNYSLFQTWPTSFKVTPDSGYIITGGSWHSGGTVSAFDVFLLKTDKDGNEQWATTYDSIQSNPQFQLYHESGNEIIIDSDNGYLVTGVAGNDELIILKTDASGILQWVTKDTGQTKALGESIAIVENNSYLVAGSTTSNLWNTPQAYLVKFDHNGNKIWGRSFGWAQSNFSLGYSVRIDIDGNYVFAGIGSYTGNQNGEMLLIKTDTAGNFMWEKTFPTATYSAAYEMEITSESGYILTGQSFDSSGAGYSVYIVKIDSTGALQWSNNYSGTFSYSIDQTTDNGFIIAGQKNNDQYLLKIAENGVLLSSNDIDKVDFKILAYPNPSSKSVTLFLDVQTCFKYKIEIFDAMGRKISSVENLNSFEKIVLEKELFSKGLNYIRIIAANFSSTGKIIIE